LLLESKSLSAAYTVSASGLAGFASTVTTGWSTMSAGTNADTARTGGPQVMPPSPERSTATPPVKFSSLLLRKIRPCRS